MYDHISDRGKQVGHGIALRYQLDAPAALKQASAERLTPPADLPNTAYADPTTRTFPLHTKEATILSAVYLFGQLADGEKWASAMPADRVVSRLERAASFFGVTDDVNAVRADITKQAAASFKHDLVPDDYAICEEHDGRQVLRFPAINAPSTKRAAAALYANRTAYPYPWRRKAATRILNRAMQYSAHLDHDVLAYLTKASGICPADNHTASILLTQRAVLFPESQADTLHKVASAVEQGAADNADSRLNLCELLDTCDRDMRKTSLYARGLPMPEELLYDVPAAKSASAAESVTLTTGNTYDVASLLQVPNEAYRVLGDDVYTSLLDSSGALDAKQMADAIPTLPRPDAQLLETALKGYSVEPRQESKTAGRRRNHMADSLEEWDRFLASKGSRANQSFMITAPLRHADDLHDHLTVT